MDDIGKIIKTNKLTQITINILIYPGEIIISFDYNYKNMNSIGYTAILFRVSSGHFFISSINPASRGINI